MPEPVHPSADPVAALVSAVRASDAVAVAGLLERHPELRTRLDDPLPGLDFGATALLAAVPGGSRELIDLLLRAGANINQKSHWWAGGFGVLDADHDLVPFLIERGAVVDVHAAARHGLLERLEQLISADPDQVHARGGDGQTPLHVAASPEVAWFLLDRGADIDALDVDHESTPAQYMVHDRQQVARALVARGCRTDILMAAALGDLERVRRHLDADPDCIRTRVSDQYFPRRGRHAASTIYRWTLGWGRTPHRVARDHGHADVLQLLMERSPLELHLLQACELGDRVLVEELMARRPHPVAALSDEERRRLVDAAEDDNTEAVRLMLAAGWPLEARGSHGATPLHFAAWNGNLDMVRELLRHRPALEARCRDFGMPALGWALHGSRHGSHCRTGDYAAVVEALLGAGARAPEASNELDASEAVREVLRRHPRAE